MSPQRWGAQEWGGETVTPPTPTVRTITVDGVGWSEQPQDFQRGVAGSTRRNVYLVVGGTHYVYWTHAADTPAGVVQTGLDPQRFEPSLAGLTGVVVELPAGNVSPEDDATLLATALETIPGITSAAAAAAANGDESWGVEATTELAITTGTRDWANRGAAGLHGGHIYRIPAGAEASGWSDIVITRPIASRIEPVDADDRIWAVQLQLGATVGTRPRLQLWASTSTTSPDGTEVLIDFGQIPASQMVAGAAATIFLTPAQCTAVRDAIDGATGTNFWLEACSNGGVSYVGAATGTGFAGEQFDAEIRVENVGSNDPTVPLLSWSTTDQGNFLFLLGARLVFDRDPATTGEVRTRWGAFEGFDTYPDDVVLPDTVTGQLASVDGLEGRRIAGLRPSTASGTIAYQLMTGGTIDPDAPSMVGGTTLLDFGASTVSGGALIDAPTGDDTVRVPAAGGMWVALKGFGAVGRGQLGPGPFAGTGGPDQPSSWIRRFNTGGLLGQNPGERDINSGPDYGDPNTSFESPISAGVEFGPDNHPYAVVELFTPPIAIG